MRVVFLGSGAFAIPSFEARARRRPRGRRPRDPARPREGARARPGAAADQAGRRSAAACPSSSRGASASPRRQDGAPRPAAPRCRWSSPTARSSRRPSSTSAPRGTVNVHASLLPRYRGAAPIQWAIASGETRDRRHDHAHRRGPRHRPHPPGPRRRPSDRRRRAASLEARLARLGAELLARDPARPRRTATFTRPQDDAQATAGAAS